MMRNSERGTFLMCRFKWWLEFDERLKPITAMPALRFGTLVHAALADWYVPGVKRGTHPATAFEKHYADELKVAEKMGFRDEDGVWHEAGELGVAILTHYVDHYGKDDVWEVLVTEQPFQRLVRKTVCAVCNQTIMHDDDGWHCSAQCPHDGEEPAGWFLYAGVMDGIWRKRTDKGLWVPDHKTTAGIGPTTVKHLILDNQASGYWSFGVDWMYERGILKPKQHLSGMLYNFIRKAPPDERPQNEQGQYLNKDGAVSKVQPSPFFMRQPIYRDEFDREAARQRAAADFLEMEMTRAGELEVKKTPSSQNCVGCWAIDICELHEMGAGWEEMKDGTTKAWDPYSEHEIYAGR